MSVKNLQIDDDRDSYLLMYLPSVAESLTNNDQHFYSGIVRDTIKAIEAHRAQNVGGDVGRAVATMRQRCWEVAAGAQHSFQEQDRVFCVACAHEIADAIRKLPDDPKRGAECGVNPPAADNLEAPQ